MGEKRIIEQTASSEVYPDDWLPKDSPTEGTTKISGANLKAYFGADGTLALEEIANAIAEEYDSTHTYYNTGLVFHEGVLYQCTATSVTGTWDSTKWNAVDIKDLLDNVSTNIGYLWNTISNTIAGSYDTSSTYNTGDYAIYSLKLYRCKDDGVTGAWNSSKWEEVNIPEYIDYVLENAGIVKDVQVKTDSTYESVVDASGNAKIDLSSVTAYGEVPNLPQPIASFSDGAVAPMMSLKVGIEPQQDLHGYDYPWAGGAGKNKFDKDSAIVGYWDPNGKYLVVDSYRTIYMKVKPNTTYAVSGISGWDSWRLCYFDSLTPTTFTQRNIDIASTFTTNNDTVLVSFSPSASSYGDGNGVQVEEGSTATSFAPYSNICPISGWSAVNVSVSGVNVWDEVMELGMISDTTGENLENDTRLRTKNYIPIKGGLPFGGVFPFSSDDVKYYFFDANKNFISHSDWQYKGAYTPPNNACFMRFWVSASYGTTYNNDISINYPSTDTDYHAYNGQTYTIDLDGTRYGGTLDVVSGSGVDTRKYVELGTLNWKNNGTDCVFADILDIEIDGFAISDKLVQVATGTVVRNMPNYSFKLYDNSARIAVKYEGIDSTNASELLSGFHLLYELDTPTPFTTQPTAVKSLLGSNNVWADTGDINECIYQRDMSSTIDDIIARLEALENA